MKQLRSLTPEDLIADNNMITQVVNDTLEVDPGAGALVRAIAALVLNDRHRRHLILTDPMLLRQLLDAMKEQGELIRVLAEKRRKFYEFTDGKKYARPGVPRRAFLPNE